MTHQLQRPVTRGEAGVPAEPSPMGPDGPAPLDAQAFIATLDEVDLVRFRVVGAYARYDEAVRNALQDTRQKILAGFEPPGRKRENHLIWAAPGTGKTYFVQQVAAALSNGIRYHELNLAKCSAPEFRSGLGALDPREPCLCLIDEVDAQPQEPWPYEVLLPYLDAAVEHGARFVFVLAGSSGASLEEIKQRHRRPAQGHGPPEPDSNRTRACDRTHEHRRSAPHRAESVTAGGGGGRPRDSSDREMMALDIPFMATR